MTEIKRHSRFSFFYFALWGILRTIRTERNFKIHLLAAFLVILLGFIVGLTRIEWLVIVLIIFSILAAETFNSAIEEVCDLIKKKHGLGYEETKLARNIAAGAVLLLAIASIILGLIIFLPYLITFKI